MGLGHPTTAGVEANRKLAVSYLGANARYWALFQIAKVWIKVCNAQSEPYWSMKKAEPKLRMLFEK